MIVLLAFTFQVVQAQTVIQGKLIEEESNLPIEGATIVIKETQEVATTDSSGFYSITTNALPPYNLAIYSLGYDDKSITLNEVNGPVNIPLKSIMIDEVVVVGYGQSTKKELIGAIAKVDIQAAKTFPVASVDAQLQGRASGVQVNTFSGTPGEGVRVQIRGTASINAGNDPLYVIDGVFVNNNSLATINLGSKKTSPLADINPADIESMEVLKDASAIAIYGSRGANGVILVTTKKGDYDSKGPIVNFNVTQGWQWADKKRLWKLASGPEHAEIVNQQWINSGIDNPALNQTYANRPFRPVSEVIAGVPGRGNPEDQQTYDRLSRVFRIAQIRSYDLNVSGGNKTTRYYTGLGYTKQEGILKPSSFDRFSFKLNFETKLSKKLTFGSINGIYRTFRQQVRGGAGQEGGHLLAALHAPTYQPIYNPDGTYARPSLYENVDILTNTDLYNINTTSIRYVGNQFLEWEIIKDLKVRSSFGLDYNHYREKEFFSDKTIIGGVQNSGGYRSDALTAYTVFQNEQTLSYKKTIKEIHDFHFVFGNSIQSSTADVTSATGIGFPNNQFQEISAASTRISSQSKSKATLASFFGRVNYGLKGKYFLEVALRADGSSKFNPKNRWGYFPAIGLAWRIKDENFLKYNYVISDLKLRVSAGQAGNQNNIGDFASQGLIGGNGAYPDNLTSGPKPGTSPVQLANPDLKWETTTSYNAGLDVGFLKNKILVDLNVYYKYTKDVLLSLPIPTSTGYASILSNQGEISNKGIELGISTINMSGKNYSWRTTFNISRNVSRAEKLVNPLTFESREYIRTEEGAPLQSFWLYKQLYVDQQTGNAVIEDVNGDGQINSSDRQLLGNLFPDFYGGLSNTIEYKGFDFGFLFSYQYGNKVFNFNKYILEGGGTRDASRSILASQLEAWTTPGQQTNTPRVTSVGNNYNLEQNSRYLEDGSFIRLKSVTLGYTLPKKWSNSVKLDNVRVYAQGTNLLLFTKYTGPDPESSGSAIPNQQGLDTATPPQPMGFLFGANITIR